MTIYTLSNSTADRIVNQDIMLYDILTCVEDRIQDGEQELLQQMYNDIASDCMLHPDNDHDEILSELYEQIAADYA